MRVFAQVCPASGLPCNCGAAAKDNGQAQSGHANGTDHSHHGSNSNKTVPAREPLFPAELKRLEAQELCLPGRCTWLRCSTCLGLGVLQSGLVASLAVWAFGALRPWQILES